MSVQDLKMKGEYTFNSMVPMTPSYKASLERYTLIRREEIENTQRFLATATPEEIANPANWKA
jgi:hypothetical protein